MNSGIINGGGRTIRVIRVRSNPLSRCNTLTNRISPIATARVSVIIVLTLVRL
ncbi:hypothetical protein ACMTAS_1018 [Thermotoga neapolitana DSM 4359]|nr:hypothetical protein Tmari_0980 [Thermotoga maritima MSB8]